MISPLVLLVDDEVPFVESMTKLLSTRDLRVISACSGKEALQALDKNPNVDVVILDVKMPGMDGVETLREIKKVCPLIEVIMLTGHGTVESALEGMGLGAFAYLPKPIDIESLIERVEAAYENKTMKAGKVGITEVFGNKGLTIEADTLEQVMERNLPRLFPHSPLSDAVGSLRRMPGSVAPDELYVLNEAEELVGKITRKDILTAVAPLVQEENITTAAELSWKELLEKGCGSAASWPVSKIMDSEVPSLPPDSAIMEAAVFMINNRLSQLPVVEGRKLVGTIRKIDILLALSSVIGETL